MSNSNEQDKETGLERVYRFLMNFITENGYSPSVREICEATGLSSTASVSDHLMELELMGRIDMKRNAARTIRLVGYKLVKMEGSVNGNR